MAAVILAVLPSACAADSGASDESDLESFSFLITSGAWNVGYAPFVVADEAGYFAAEGLDPEYQLTGGANQAAQLLQQGTTGAGAITLPPVVLAAQESRGGNLQLYSQFYRRNIVGVMVPADSDIQDAEDLEGANIGVTDSASIGVQTAQAILESVGLGPDAASIVEIGVGSQQIQAIKSGQVDALSLFDTQYAILEVNGIELRKIDAPEVDALVGGGFTATADRLEENPDFYTKVARAVAKATLFTQTSPEAAIRMVWEAHPDSKPDAPESQAMEEARAVLDARMENLILEDGETQWGSVTVEQMQDYIDFMDRAGLLDGPVDADSIVRTDLIDDINDFGADAVVEEAQSWGEGQ